VGVASKFWSVRFARWPRRRRPVRPGYSLLLPVPGDLPVFLDLALAVCRLQDHEHRRATLVLPDRPSTAVREAVAREAPTWPGGGLELHELPLVDRLVLPRLNDPGRNHGAQIIAGVTAATTEHVVLHDADLFMLDDRLHDSLVETAVRRRVDVLGISPAWDGWYAERGRELAATWEQTTRTEWLRRYPPHRHIGHEAAVDGGTHVFDTTFWAQYASDPSQVAVVADAAEGVVHFNYVISTYRRFQRSTGRTYDNNYRLLLIRLLVDLFDRSGAAYDVPGLDELARGLPPSPAVEARVLYDREAGGYDDFREKVGRILAGRWVDQGRARRAETLLRPFDEALGNG